MRIGMVGLGKMGGNMTQRLIAGGHDVIGYDVVEDNVLRAAEAGATSASSLHDMVKKLTPPRVIWIMVPSGKTVDDAIHELAPVMAAGDILIDGGNSRYTESIRRAEELTGTGIHYMDIGVSGGIWGLKEGYCLMAGGDKSDFDHVEPILKTLAPTNGYAYVGGHGAGHFVKMVHNGIEYGMLEAYGEGFELMKASPFDLHLEQISNLWLHGSVVRSWLLELAAREFAEDPDLSDVKGYVEDSGEGRWTVEEAIDLAVPVPAISAALFARFRSREVESFSAKVIAALRHQFGGHRVEKEIGQPQAGVSKASTPLRIKKCD